MEKQLGGTGAWRRKATAFYLSAGVDVIQRTVAKRESP